MACKDHSVRSDLAQAEQQQQTQVRESEQLKLAQEAAHLQFGAEQNDLEGYDGIAWGSEPSANLTGKQIDEARDSFGDAYDVSYFHGGSSSVLYKIVGAPGSAGHFSEHPASDPTGGLFFHAYEAGAPGFDYFVNQQKSVYYAYYQGKFVCAFARVEGDYRQIESTLEGKYSMQRELAVDAWGDGTNDAVASPVSRVDGVFTGKLYKRGNTNTRIYLLQEIVNGFPNHVWLVYIPNAYLAAIHDEWWAKFERAQREEIEKKENQNEQVRQADQQKIQ